MKAERPAMSCTVTCETHDEAVLHCLNALAHFAERDGERVDTAAEGGAGAIPAPRGWTRDEGRVRFEFSDHRRRGLFLGEATRLLSGKWTRVEAVTR